MQPGGPALRSEDRQEDTAMRMPRLLERESILAPLMLAPVAIYMVLLVGFPFLMA